MRPSVVEPFSWPITQMLSPLKRPNPPTMAAIVAELAIPGQRHKIRDQRGHVIEAVGPLRMTRDLGLLPRRQPRIKFVKRRRRLGFEPPRSPPDTTALPVS